MKKAPFIYILLLLCLKATAQQTDRDFVRRGNSFYRDSMFIKAEENYLKALDKNSESSNAIYNLGNAYIEQQKIQEAVDQYKKAVTIMELDKNKLINSGVVEGPDLKDAKELTAMAYHNLGVIFQASQDFQNAITAYKQALRNNPHDHETRYNLALAMSQLDQQSDDQEQQDQDNNREEEQEQQNERPEEQQSQQNEEYQDISKENAEQLLQAAMQDEKEVQERIRQAIQVQPKKQLDKDW